MANLRGRAGESGESRADLAPERATKEAPQAGLRATPRKVLAQMPGLAACPEPDRWAVAMRLALALEVLARSGERVSVAVAEARSVDSVLVSATLAARPVKVRELAR